MLKALDLFSGIGSFALGMQWTGQIETVAFCDPDPFCQAVLMKDFPGVPIYDDVRTLPADLGAIDIICGGLPTADDRWLWPAMLAQIQQYRPRFVMAENVTGLVTSRLGPVLSDLEAAGYSAGAVIVPSEAVGAPHEHARVFVLAHSDRVGLVKAGIPGDSIEAAGGTHPWRAPARGPDPRKAVGNSVMPDLVHLLSTVFITDCLSPDEFQR
jgi:DNA (cytosine-5)-methyltransferase 1